MISWDRVNELRDEVGEEDFQEVVDLFLEEVGEVVDRLSDSDAGALERDLHFLKGSAANLGFDSLASLCESGERAAAGGSTNVDLAGIIQEFSASRDEFLGQPLA